MRSEAEQLLHTRRQGFCKGQIDNERVGLFGHEPSSIERKGDRSAVGVRGSIRATTVNKFAANEERVARGEKCGNRLLGCAPVREVFPKVTSWDHAGRAVLLGEVAQGNEAIASDFGGRQ